VSVVRRALAACALAALGAAASSCGHRGAGTGSGDAKGDARPGTTARMDGGAVSGGGALAAIDRAEDGRRAGELPGEWGLSSEPVVRRRAIRALARTVEPPIDGPVDAALLRALADEDLEVTGWAAYGLGWACKGREDEHVKALAARAATLADATSTGSGRAAIDAPAGIARAIGRCGGALAEGVLAGMLRSELRSVEVPEVAFALGSVAGRGALSDEAMGALLDRAAGDAAHPGESAALYPIGRLEHVPDAWTARVLAAARAALTRPSPVGPLAVRALEKAGPEALGDLGRVASRSDLGPAERAEAARALGRVGGAGRDAAAAALVKMLQDRSLLEPAALSGDLFNVLLAVVEALGQDAPKSADAGLYSLTGLPLPPRDAPGLLRRTVRLRCSAAAALARAAYDADVLAKCDPDPEGATGQRARLAALARRPIVTDRRKAFRALVASPHLAVREAALEVIALHPELEETGRALLVEALGAPEAGVVATAAQVIVQHPEHVLVLAKSERRAALDPRAPPPTAHPAMDLPADLAAALTRAVGRAWREDAVETVAALLDAAVAVSLPDARAAATRSCSDPNVTLREHAARALRALGVPQAACPRPPSAKDAPSPAASAPLAHPVRVTFETDAAKVAVVFEPELAPRAASRFVALARSGFYRGVVVHRVVPGYVVQLGDPGGDGYGGSGSLLRCETSPVPFGPLDVGVALAGRDTGSSQIFVTLARYPKLDGDYARVGRAEGDWAAVAEGDVITGVRVEE